jgi:hypothetical protein
MNIPLPCPASVSPEDLQRLEREFATYRRELPRLLGEGHAGRAALIREDQIVGVWDTPAEASEEGRRQFGLQPISVKRIDPRDVERLVLLDARTETTCRS